MYNRRLNLLNTYFLSSNRSNKSEQGFNLIEVAVVVVIIGIFAGIGVPAWNGFLSRQRTRSVNNQVLQVLQSAQNEAKRTKQNITVQFESSDPPTVTINGSEQILNLEGEIEPGMIELETKSENRNPQDNNEITFENSGKVDDPNNDVIPFQVTVSRPGGNGKRCVRVETLLGAMRIAEGDNCL